MAETRLEAGPARPWDGMRAAASSYTGSLALTTAALTLILMLGGALRFHGLGWDKPAGAQFPLQMHPDERFLSLVSNRLDWPGSMVGWPPGTGGYFDTARSPLNPYNDGETQHYVYGTFPLFLVKAVATMAGDDPAGPGNSYDTTVTWGRRLTAFTDTMTVLLVFGIAGALFGRLPGLLAALLYALAVLPTQLAHFWTMDPYVAFFGAATLLLCIHTVRTGHPALFLAMGVTAGLGLASKVTAFPLVMLPVLAVVCRIALREGAPLGLRWSGERLRPAGNWAWDGALLCLTLAVALLVFRVGQPYAFSGPNFWDMGISERWKDDILQEVRFQSGAAEYPPFVQFADRSPFLTPLRNIILFGLGPGLGMTAVVASVAAGVLLFRRRELAFVLPLALLAAVFLYQGPRFVAFMRYFLPMYPALCVLAAWGLVTLYRTASSRDWRRGRLLASRRTAGRFAAVVVGVVLASTLLWALAFQNVYREEHPRIAASRWIYDNIPPGAAITGEHWDDTLPYGIPGESSGQYRLVELALYEPDSPRKVYDLVYGPPGPADVRSGGLNAADFVAVSSGRVRDSTSRLEREYPATTRYYQLLESGGLGFEPVATFSVRPSLFGVTVDDSGAEEAFTVYDHPEVRLYRKTSAWDPERAVALLNEAYPERATNLLPSQGRTNGLQYTPAEAARQQAGGTFSEIFDPDGWASHFPWLWLLLWMQIAGFAALPWCTWLFRALPGRGYGLSKMTGAVAVVLPVWLLVAWGPADFSGELAWAALGLAVAVGATTAMIRAPSLARDFREHWPAWAAAEAVFLMAFFAFLALRAANPDLWYHPTGGEKPMELAYFTAVARSTELPPYDPWFGGGYLNYYYMGWFFLAVPARALRLVPEVAFNLGIPAFASLAAVTAFSTVQALVGLTVKVGTGTTSARNVRGPILAGLLAAFLLVAVGNMDGIHQTVERFQAVNTWGALEGVPVLGGAVGLVGGLYRWMFDGASLPQYDWWRSSRVHIGTFDITEFPYWTFLFADLHAHLMALPFFGLAIGLAVAYAASARAGLAAQSWALAVALGLAIGLIRAVHTWDFPASVVIVAAAVAGGQIFAPGRWQTRWWRAAGHLVVAGLVATIVFQPYTSHVEVFNSGLIRSPETTRPQQFFAYYGLFLCLALAFIVTRYAEEVRRDSGRNLVLGLVRGPVQLLCLGVFIVGAAAFTWSFGLTVVALGLIIEVFLLNLLLLEWRDPERQLGRTLATALFAIAFGIAAGVDVVTVKDDIVRMNTVFKFSLQAWQLFALSSAFATWYVLSGLWRAAGDQPVSDYPGFERRPVGRWLAVGATLSGAALLLAASIFLWSGTRARQDARFADTGWTLDGFAYFEQAPVFVEDLGTPDPSDDRPVELAQDLPLIRWLRENVEGSPVIVEAVGPLYHWTGRISWNTGLPAVIGWDNHQNQQRHDYTNLIAERRQQTQQFYRDPSPAFAEQYLRKYNVAYVVVGTEERVYGTPEGLAKFDSMPALTEVFADGEHAIYRVDQSKLPAPVVRR